MTTEITQVWELFDLVKPFIREVRAFHHSDKSRVQRRIFRPAEFKGRNDFKQAMEEYASELNEQGFNVYISLNPVNREFKGKSAADADIKQFEYLLVDIDRTGDTKNPATDEDIRMATSLGDAIYSFLAELGWPKPTRLMSGNGHHLYYRLNDLPNNSESTNLIKRVLKCLAARFDGKDFSVDRVVYNASRITKFPGTIMRKGIESDDRPYRRATRHEY